MRFLPWLALLAAATATGSASGLQADDGAGAFSSVELRGGGEVVIRRGSTPGFVYREGDQASRPARVTDGRLTIDPCQDRCPRGHRLKLEVTMPELNSLSVTDGGRIRAEAGFPRLPTFRAEVSQGGAIDMRALEVEALTASIAHGGVILARPRLTLDARIEQGGRINYWGSPQVRPAVQNGGVVERGREEDLTRPITDLNPRVPPVPPVPALAPRH